MTPYAKNLLTLSALRMSAGPTQRACQRKSYLRLYLVVSSDAPFALTSAKDGCVLAFTDWAEALANSVPFKGIVTNYDEFTRRGFVARMSPTPPAMRILHTDKKGVAHSYWAQFDADPEELRTLNQVTPYDARHTPEATKAMRAKAKVWEEV